MDLQTFCEMTDVTAIGYGISSCSNMLCHSMVKRVCVDSIPAVVNASRKGLRVSSVLNFPFGQESGSAKELILSGAHELDIPIPINMIRERLSRSWTSWLPWVDSLGLPVRADLTFKIILHTDYIEVFSKPPSSIIKSMAFDIKQAFMSRYPQSLDLVFKTSTGYGPGGATPEAVKALAEEGYRVKASGKIRSKADVEELAESGASLFGIGFSSFNNIIKEFGGENGNNEPSTVERSNPRGASE